MQWRTRLFQFTMKVGIVASLLLHIFYFPPPAKASPPLYENVTYPLNPTPVLGQAINFSASAQATYRLKAGGTAVDPNYEKNVKVFWAWVSPANRDLSVLNSMDLSNFEGILPIAPGETIDTNPVFGPYGSYQGMQNILIGNGIMGGGACNTNGMFAQAMWYAGFEVTVTCLGHPAQYGVESRFWATVQSGTSCTVLAKNMAGIQLYLHWQVSGDNIALWVDDKVTLSNGSLIPTANLLPQTAASVPAAQPEYQDLPVQAMEYTLLMSEDTVFQPVNSEGSAQNTEPSIVASSTQVDEVYQVTTLPVNGVQYTILRKPLILILIVLIGIILISSLIQKFPSSKPSGE